MSAARNALLWISENRKLREALPRYKFIRRAVARFMPGENLEDAIAGADRLKQQSIQTVFTHLGENVSDASEAKNVAADYVEMLKQIQKTGLDTHVSVKLTHLGLDLDESLCLENLQTIVREAEARNTMAWIDMEQSTYVDRTLAMFRAIRKEYRDVGLCLQTYLFRTEKDLIDLLRYPLQSGLSKAPTKSRQRLPTPGNLMLTPTSSSCRKQCWVIRPMVLGWSSVHTT